MKSAPVQIALQTTSHYRWPKLGEAITFELEQAGYVVVGGDAVAHATLTFSVDRDRWVLELRDHRRGTQYRRIGRHDEPAQLVAVHAAGLVHASLVEFPAQKAEPATSMTATVEPQTGPQAPVSGSVTPKTEPTTSNSELGSAAQVVDTSGQSESDRPVEKAESSPAVARSPVFVGEVGGALSFVGLVGPRIGFAGHWRHLELGFAGEVGFVESGVYPRDVECVDRCQWERQPVPRLQVRVGYAFRTRSAIRPFVGISNVVAVPIVAVTGQVGDPPRRIEDLEPGVLWVPGLEGGIRAAFAPMLALRVAARVGPTIRIVEPQLVEGETVDFPGAIASLSVSLLVGKTRSRVEWAPPG
ncbi:MAG: hypothetical protein B7733_17395 [Myxococcales bacterium FL481]|nr:MAG: hypothetical protein B7733_17395 [Myxococcales bacterium FL481]